MDFTLDGKSIGFLGWMAVAGALLLVMALASAYLRRLPVSTSAIYLACGALVGPLGLNLVHMDLLDSAPWFERLTEVAVILSLFIGGLKLRLPLRNSAWIAPVLLAGPVMLVCIVCVALFLHWALGLAPPFALLLGAILAPTDPVLASTVSISNARDCDRMRYGLSGEAGLNDGTAFPFVVFALTWAAQPKVGEWIGSWVVLRLLWAVPAGLGLGFFLGKVIGRLAIWLRSRHQDTAAPSDFLALALVALSYVGAEAIGAWGFLATFAAGVGLRRAEITVVRENPHPDPGRNLHVQDMQAEEGNEDPILHPPAEDLVAAKVNAEDLKEPAVAAGVLVAEVLSFGDTAERLLEVMLVVFVGASLAVHWDVRAIPISLALFLVIRPLSAYLFLLRTGTTPVQRWLMGWFGIRGVGSLYYLSYALSHGVFGARAVAAVDLTLSVVALSILVHGISAQPVLSVYERMLARSPEPSVAAPRA